MVLVHRTHWQRARLLAASMSIAAGVAACGQGTSAPQTPVQLLAASAKAFAALKSFHISGGFIVSSTSDVYMTATVLHDGDASGSLTVGGESANFVVQNQLPYFDSLASFVADGITDPGISFLCHLLEGQHWWQTPGSPPVRDSFALLQQGTYGTRFFTGRGQLSASAGKDSRGRQALNVTDGSLTFLISQSVPYQLLEIRSAPHYLAVDLSSLDLIFDSFNARASVARPASFVTATSDGLPPYYVVQSIDFNGQCTDSGCPVKAVVLGAAGSGTANVSFTVADSNKKTLGTCSATTSVPGPGETGTATCVAGGSAWESFYLYTGGSYSLSATVANPGYAEPSSGGQTT